MKRSSLPYLRIVVPVAILAGILLCWLETRQNSPIAEHSPIRGPVPIQQSTAQIEPPQPLETHFDVKPAETRSAIPAKPSKEQQRKIDREADHRASLEIVVKLYDPLIQKLDLTEADRQKLEELLCDERQSVFDAMTLGRSQGLSLSGPYGNKFAQLMLDAATISDPEIKQTVGTDKFAIFSSYRTSLVESNTVNKIYDNLAESNYPLTEEQSVNLLNLYNEMRSPDRTRYAPVRSLLMLGGLPLTEDLLTKSQTVLSAGQIGILKQAEDANVNSKGSPGLRIGTAASK